MHNTVVIKICKELLNLDRNLIMISSYIPPPDSPANSLPNALSGIEILEQTVLELNDIITEEVYDLMCGDFNARTAEFNSNSDRSNVYYA